MRLQIISVFQSLEKKKKDKEKKKKRESCSYNLIYSLQTANQNIRLQENYKHFIDELWVPFGYF